MFTQPLRVHPPKTCYRHKMRPPVQKLKRAVVLGENDLLRALQTHLGIADVFLGGRVKHPTLNGAGAGLSVEDPSGEEPAQEEG